MPDDQNQNQDQNQDQSKPTPGWEATLGQRLSETMSKAGASLLSAGLATWGSGAAQRTGDPTFAQVGRKWGSDLERNIQQHWWIEKAQRYQRERMPVFMQRMKSQQEAVDGAYEANRHAIEEYETLILREPKQEDYRTGEGSSEVDAGRGFEQDHKAWMEEVVKQKNAIDFQHEQVTGRVNNEYENIMKDMYTDVMSYDPTNPYLANMMYQFVNQTEGEISEAQNRGASGSKAWSDVAGIAQSIDTMRESKANAAGAEADVDLTNVKTDAARSQTDVVLAQTNPTAYSAQAFDRALKDSNGDLGAALSVWSDNALVNQNIPASIIKEARAFGTKIGAFEDGKWQGGMDENDVAMSLYMLKTIKASKTGHSSMKLSQLLEEINEQYGSEAMNASFVQVIAQALDTDDPKYTSYRTILGAIKQAEESSKNAPPAAVMSKAVELIRDKMPKEPEAKHWWQGIFDGKEEPKGKKEPVAAKQEDTSDPGPYGIYDIGRGISKVVSGIAGAESGRTGARPAAKTEAAPAAATAPASEEQAPKSYGIFDDAPKGSFREKFRQFFTKRDVRVSEIVDQVDRKHHAAMIGELDRLYDAVKNGNGPVIAQAEKAIGAPIGERSAALNNIKRMIKWLEDKNKKTASDKTFITEINAHKNANDFNVLHIYGSFIPKEEQEAHEAKAGGVF